MQLRIQSFQSTRSLLRCSTILATRTRSRTAHITNTLVHESLSMLPLHSADDEDAAELVDKLWSMQYLVPGPICGSAGRLIPLSSANPPPPSSHAVVFRYGQLPVLERFLSHLKTKEAIKNCANMGSSTVPTLCYDCDIPNELEAIFRKGPEWESGFELVIALTVGSGQSKEDAMEFLNLTKQLATSSVYGAVQASYGICKETIYTQPEQQGAEKVETGMPDFILLVRFLTREQLDAFITCPPVAAMLEGDDRSPLSTLWAGALVIESSEQDKQQGLSGGLM